MRQGFVQAPLRRARHSSERLHRERQLRVHVHVREDGIRTHVPGGLDAGGASPEL